MPDPPEASSATMRLEEEYAFFRQVTRRICGNLAIDEALWQCLLYLQDFMPAERLSLGHYNPPFGTLDIIAHATLGGIDKRSLRYPVPMQERGRFQEQAPPRVLRIDRPEDNPIARRIFEITGTSSVSLMVMRLALGDKRLGSCTIHAKGTNAFSDEHSRLFALLHDPFCMALLNGLRYREMVDLKELLADNCRYLQGILQQVSGAEVVGEHLGLREVMEQVRQVAPLGSPVLLLGETGTGKDVIANAIHSLSPRFDGAFIKVNCGAIPETLVDSELFGHDKGAFTGAVVNKRGYFERADGGTIFLDEIGEMPPQAQVRLLHVLEDRTIERVGGSSPRRVDIRVIAATNKDLESLVEGGRFREDLFYRLRVFPIAVPPLRDRKVDVPALVKHFLTKKSGELRLPSIPPLAPEAIDQLMAYDWPGNVRELAHSVERALIVSQGSTMSFDAFGVPTRKIGQAPNEPAAPHSLDLDEVISAHVRRVLELADGRIEGRGGAAELLAVNPATLRNRMRKLGIPFGRKGNKKAPG
jgi:transcriptional regulator with GAF, ATPase, and Fis domain